ncbi:MAG TPA: ABC transporter ATP-binding protein [Actinomycetota bacterium]|nr:ABC transporter ATP-binding protein [Actinomycetota bacterium]
MPLLEAKSINVTFGGHRALIDVSLDARAGKITGLIGPNGAGKTTCFNVLSGLQPPDSGHVLFDGEDISSIPAFKRGRLGMARTFQRIEVFGSLTVFENVLVAAEIRRRWARGQKEKDDGDVREESDEIVNLVGLRKVADRRVDSIPTGLARLTELARGLATRPRLILLDEPSSGLDDDESDAFGELLITLAKRGIGILLVEHDIDLVMQVCDWIHVLEFGSIIANGTAKQVRNDKRVQAAYLGSSA